MHCSSEPTVDAGMGIIVAVAASSGPGEEVVDDALLVGADWVGTYLGFVASLGWVDRRGIGSLAVTMLVQGHNKICEARTLLLVLRS
jgi:hypothetical protein